MYEELPKFELSEELPKFELSKTVYNSYYIEECFRV